MNNPGSIPNLNSIVNSIDMSGVVNLSRIFTSCNSTDMFSTGFEDHLLDSNIHENMNCIMSVSDWLKRSGIRHTSEQLGLLESIVEEDMRPATITNDGCKLYEPDLLKRVFIGSYNTRSTPFLV